MTYRPKGKHVNIDDEYPEALGICDFTGFVHMRKDLIKQMEWRGNALIWTGFLVGRDYLDKPNAQLRPPQLKPDPVPVRIPRLPLQTIIVWNTIQTFWNDNPYTWNELATIDDGIPALPEDERLFQAQNVYFGSFG